MLLLCNLRYRIQEWMIRRQTRESSLTPQFIGPPKYSVCPSSAPQKAWETWDTSIAVWFARKDDPSL